VKIILSLFLFLFMSLANAEIKNADDTNFHCSQSSKMQNTMHMGFSNIHSHADCTQSSAINNSTYFSEIVTSKTKQFSLMVDASYESIISTIATPPPII